jgi:hypothetical protein
MNPVEIDKKILEDLKTIRTPEELRELQKWARKAKKNPVHSPKLQCFGKIYYSFESISRGGSGSKARYRRTHTVEYCYFIFLGLKVILEENNNKNYIFSDELFDNKQVWGDAKLKNIGREYYPKQNIEEWEGMNIENKFFEYLKEKKYHLLKTSKKLYLSKDDSVSRKIITGRKLRKWEKEETPSFSLNFLNFFDNKGIEVKDYESYFPNIDYTESDLDDIFKF